MFYFAWVGVSVGYVHMIFTALLLFTTNKMCSFSGLIQAGFQAVRRCLSFLRRVDSWAVSRSGVLPGFTWFLANFFFFLIFWLRP